MLTLLLFLSSDLFFLGLFLLLPRVPLLLLLWRELLFRLSPVQLQLADQNNIIDILSWAHGDGGTLFLSHF